MSKKFRSLNRFVVALALVAAAVSARAGVQMFAAPPSSFDQLPDLRFNQGQTVTVAFAASGFPAGLTYTAEGLPPGLSLTMGVDQLGHEVGILNGTLPADTPQGGGSEGVYTMRIRASDGAVSNDFSVDVSHWNQGDVFVGGGEWRYQVYRDDGSFKTDVTVPDDPLASGGFTTGCAVNWNTGEVWATNFDEVDPALNVITRHAGNNPLPYTDPSRRLSTLRFRDPGDASPMDINPESVAFDNFGNMFVGHSFGFWNNNGDVADIDGVATILSNPGGPGWVYVDAAGQPRLAAGNELIFDTQPISPAGFFERWIQGNPPQNLLDGDGAPIRVRDQAGMDLHRYAPDANGNYSTADRTFFDVRYGYTGVDTLDLLSDQKTIAYSSENWYVYRYDVSAGAQLPVVGSAVVGESKPVTTRSLYGIRALPPGDGSGGYLVVNEYNIDRIDAQGNIIQQYDFRDDADYPPADNPNPAWAPRDVNGWFAIAIAAGGRSFWAATRQDVFHFDIASGEIIGPKIRATEGVLHTNTELAGLCVMDEYRAAQEVCGPTGNGNGIDDDHDGTIDEGCFRIEICSALRPGDDDGDGLVNYNDPDCGATPQQQCNTSGATDNSVAGICDRADYEGDNVTVPGVPLPCSNDFDCSSWTFSYSADGLPPGLIMNPQTGDVSGIPLFSIVNPNSELSPPVVYPITVHATWQQQGQPATTFNNSFNWTIYNRNRVPVANDDGPQSVIAGDSFSFDVRLNDSDIDGDTFTILSFTQPAPGQGTVVQQGQNLVYTAPVSGFGGTTTFTYKVKDTYNPAGESNDATVTVIVNGPPVAVNDNYVALWNTTLNVPVALGIIRNAPGRDSDPEGMPISVIPSSVTSPSHGTVTVNADGSFDYTPNTGFYGVDTYTYRITDGTLESNTATVTITVHRPPVGVDDFYVTPMNVPLVLAAPGIMSNDSDPEGGAITVVLGSLGHVVNGTLAVQANGAIVYTPNLNWTGVETFNYRVKNAYYESENTTVTIKVNDVPLAVNDAFTTAEDTPVSASLTGNDTPSRDGGNVWTKTSNPANGTATVNPDGTFTYTPNANFNGADSFTYKVCDVDSECSNATVTITISAVDDLPVAVDDAFTTPEDTPVSGTLTGNDTPSGDGGNVWTKTSNPSNGTATVNADGTFTYTPNANFHGTDSFTYRLCDVDGDCATATVTITITSVNDVPVAVNDSFTTPEDTPVSGTLKTNDTLSGDGGNVWTKASDPSNGTATVNPDGTFTYTPNANFNGTDSFTYTLCDADGDCATATVTITITSVDDAPIAVNDAFTTDEDTPVAGTLTGNDTPSGDGGNVWSKVTNPANGTAVVNADGTFTYTPNANFFGTDVFTYRVCDTDGDCSTATVTITIRSVNDVPLAMDDAFTTTEDTPVSGTVVTNDTLSGDGGNVWTLLTSTSNGTLTFVNGAFTYTPRKDFSGIDSFTYKICDVNGDCSSATVIITINPVNDVPVAVNDVYTMAPNTSITKDVSGNDTPSGDGGNVWTKTSNPSSGTVVFNADGTFTYTAATGFSGVVSFNYKLCDVNNDCSNATVTITIAAVSTGAVGKGDTATIGYWQNQNGQALIKKMNGSTSATNLGNWLAGNFPYLWGANASNANNLTGKTNTQVAAYYITVFKSDKWMAQVLAGAIASYVTNSTLAGGNYSVPYGFNYSVTGTGSKTYNVGSYGTAIGLANNTSYTISALLQQANLRKQQGNYNSNAFNVIFSGINQAGDIK
ncbi:MAG: tandem-95 repeat protein [Acidobacteria bacterium]|nr:MAG: tandem-95 repeat protein [Acidobacteriota bacterium]